jgi:RNA polymerase nonessential primary-like sigma factor
LVVDVAKKFTNKGLGIGDLISEGTTGLQRAIEKFDPTRGCALSTYAYPWIWQTMKRGIQEKARTIRLPIHLDEAVKKLPWTKRDLAVELGRNPSVRELAEKLEISIADLHLITEIATAPLSFDVLVGVDERVPLVEIIPDTYTTTPEEVAEQEEKKRTIRELLGALDDRQREVLTLRFGLNDGQERSLAEIGRKLQISRERVRQIEAQSLQILRTVREREALLEAVEAHRNLLGRDQWNVVSLHLGLKSGRGLSQKEIANTLKLGPARVRALLEGARIILRRADVNLEIPK